MKKLICALIGAASLVASATTYIQTSATGTAPWKPVKDSVSQAHLADSARVAWFAHAATYADSSRVSGLSDSAKRAETASWTPLSDSSRASHIADSAKKAGTASNSLALGGIAAAQYSTLSQDTLIAKKVASDTATVLRAGAEPALGKPDESGYLLSSSSGGTRSWVAPPTIWSLSSLDEVIVLQNTHNMYINHAKFGTAGTYGSATTVPIITTNATGHVSGVSLATITASGLGALTTVTSDTTSRTQNTVYAAPNGSTGAATFRSLVAADLPSVTSLTGWPTYFNQALLTTSSPTFATVTANLTGIASNASALGGVAASQYGTLAQDTLIAKKVAHDTAAALRTYVGSASTAGNAATATQLATARTIGMSGDVTGTATAFDGTKNITIPTTLPTLLSAGSAGSSTSVPTLTWDAKGRITSVSSVAISIPHTQISDWAATLGGYDMLSNTTFSVPVTGDGIITLASGSRIEGTYDIRWEGSARVEHLQVVVSTTQFGPNFLAINIYKTYGAANTFQRISIYQNSDASIKYLGLTIGNRNGGTNSVSVKYFGSYGTAVGGAYTGTEVAYLIPVLNTYQNTGAIGAPTIYENGVALSSKYLGINASIPHTQISDWGTYINQALLTTSSPTFGNASLGTWGNGPAFAWFGASGQNNVTNGNSGFLQLTGSGHIYMSAPAGASANIQYGGTNLITVGASGVSMPNLAGLTVAGPITANGGITGSLTGTASNASALGGVAASQYGTLAQDTLIAKKVAHDTAAALRTYVGSASTAGNAATATQLATARTIGMSGDVTGTATAFDGTKNITIPTTLPTLLSAGSAGSSTSVPTLTWDTKGRLTAVGSATISIPHTRISDWGTYINQALLTTSSPTFSSMNVGRGVITGYTGSPGWGAIYGASVIPSDTNFAVAWAIDGSSAEINGTTQSFVAVNNVNILTATSTGVSITGGLTVSGLITANGGIGATTLTLTGNNSINLTNGNRTFAQLSASAFNLTTQLFTNGYGIHTDHLTVDASITAGSIQCNGTFSPAVNSPGAPYTIRASDQGKMVMTIQQLSLPASGIPAGFWCIVNWHSGGGGVKFGPSTTGTNWYLRGESTTVGTLLPVSGIASWDGYTWYVN